MAEEIVVGEYIIRREGLRVLFFKKDALVGTIDLENKRVEDFDRFVLTFGKARQDINWRR